MQQAVASLWGSRVYSINHPYDMVTGPSNPVASKLDLVNSYYKNYVVLAVSITLKYMPVLPVPHWFGVATDSSANAWSSNVLPAIANLLGKGEASKTSWKLIPGCGTTFGANGLPALGTTYYSGASAQVGARGRDMYKFKRFVSIRALTGEDPVTNKSYWVTTPNTAPSTLIEAHIWGYIWGNILSQQTFGDYMLTCKFHCVAFNPIAQIT